MLGTEKVDDQEGQVFAGEVHDDPGHAHDAVFGRLTNDGPNYRNVSLLCLLIFHIVDCSCLGRLGGHSWTDDEDAAWPWNLVHPVSV